MARRSTSPRGALVEALPDALAEGNHAEADRMLQALEDEASNVLTEGQLDGLVAVRGRVSRLRRVALDTDPTWAGIARMRALDRMLGSAVTGLALVLRRQQPVEIPERVAAAAQGPPSRPTARERVLAALDDKPRRPVELSSRTGIGKRQLHRALGELVASGKAHAVSSAAEDDRAAFYKRAG